MATLLHQQHQKNSNNTTATSGGIKSNKIVNGNGNGPAGQQLHQQIIHQAATTATNFNGQNVLLQQPVSGSTNPATTTIFITDQQLHQSSATTTKLLLPHEVADTSHQIVYQQLHHHQDFGNVISLQQPPQQHQYNNHQQISSYQIVNNNFRTNNSHSLNQSHHVATTSLIYHQQQPHLQQQQQQPTNNTINYSNNSNNNNIINNHHQISFNKNSNLLLNATTGDRSFAKVDASVSEGMKLNHHHPQQQQQQVVKEEEAVEEGIAPGHDDGHSLNGTSGLMTEAVATDGGQLQQQEETENQEGEEAAPEIDIVINNVVCSFSVRCHLNLREIALNGFNVEFKRENGMVTMKLRRPYTTASMWSSGKITCTGATSELQAKVAARRYARCLQKLGFNVRFHNFRVVNVLGTCSMPWSIKIVNFSEKYKHDASYEPELHPGVTYKLKTPKATLKIFSTGSITVTAGSVLDVQAAIEHIFPLVYEFRKERPPNVAATVPEVIKKPIDDIEEEDLIEEVLDDDEGGGEVVQFEVDHMNVISNEGDDLIEVDEGQSSSSGGGGFSSDEDELHGTASHRRKHSGVVKKHRRKQTFSNSSRAKHINNTLGKKYNNPVAPPVGGKRPLTKKYVGGNGLTKKMRPFGKAANDPNEDIMAVSDMGDEF